MQEKNHFWFPKKHSVNSSQKNHDLFDCEEHYNNLNILVLHNKEPFVPS